MEKATSQCGESALAKDRFDSLLDITGDWMWEVCPEGNCIFSSPSVRFMIGRPPEALIGENLSRIITPQDGEALLEPCIRRVLDSGEPFRDVEIPVLRKDGGEVILAVSGLPILDEDGRITGVRGVSRNLTHQHWAEQALRKSEERYRNFIESAPIGMMISDTNGCIIYANEKMAEITGYERSAWQGRSYIDMVHPDDYGVILENRTRAIATLEPVDPYEIRIFNAAKEVVWLRLIPHSMYESDEYGNKSVAYFQNFIEDVTASKIAREEKIRLEQQLSQTHKMEALGALAGGVAHDFNNILYPIIGYVEMTLSEVGDNPFAQGNLKEVLSAAERAQKLVDQILAFSRRKKEKLLPMRIQPVVKDALSLIRSSLPHNVQLHTDINEDGGVVLADQTQIHQVVMNLCTNAYQSMRGRGGVLGVSLKQCSIGWEDLNLHTRLKPGDYVRLCISDSGGGMDDAVKDRIFEPYFTTKGPEKGSGMGLAVVHGIVAKYNGAITVESELGKGSVFTILLPVAAKNPGSAPESASIPLPKGCESLLLVGGEKQVRDISAKMLAQLGYTAASAGSGKEALEILNANPSGFDLLLTDEALDDMTGQNLINAVRRTKPGMPASLVANQTEGRLQGIPGDGKKIDIIVKPLDIKKIARSIRTLLDDGQ